MRQIAGIKKNGGIKKIRSVEQYLALLQAAGRSPVTITGYRAVLSHYAKFLSIPLDDLHNHLSVDDLVRYAVHLASYRREGGRKSALIILHRYMELCGVEFDELEYNAAKVTITEERADKPLTVDILQKMIDQASPHTRALITFLVSTGCRAGETSKILLSDVGRLAQGRFVMDIDGDVIQIRNEIAKRRKGGLVFLTREAREYLTIWLKDRERFIKDADKRTSQLFTASTRHERVSRKESGTRIARPENDQRLFACSYNTIDKAFVRLYMKADGERGVNGFARVTAHSCRAFFRTNGAKTLGIDLTEGILRHSGYLNNAYVRMTPEDRYKQFHEGEAALYITRADHRIQSGKLSQLEREKAALEERVRQLERREQTAQKLNQLRTVLSDEDRESLKKLIIDELKEDAARSK